jgi:hypothetical protein
MEMSIKAVEKPKHCFGRKYFGQVIKQYRSVYLKCMYIETSIPKFPRMVMRLK